MIVWLHEFRTVGKNKKVSIQYRIYKGVEGSIWDVIKTADLAVLSVTSKVFGSLSCLGVIDM